MDHQGLPPVDLFIAADPDATATALLRAACHRSRRRSALPRPAPPNRTPACARSWSCRISRPRCGEATAGAARVAAASAAVVGRRHPGRSAIRSTSLARTAAAASAAGPASPSARPWRLRGIGPPAGGDLRRRRLPDGRHGAVDGRALPHPAAARRRQQPVVLQRRSPSGAHGAHARPPGREQVDRPAHERPGHRSRRDGARAGRDRRSAPCKDVADLPALLAEAVRAVAGGRDVVVDVRVEPGYTPSMASALTREDSAAPGSDRKP